MSDLVTTRMAAWAERRSDLSALVQIGSRVQPGGIADEWSDYDFQLITRRPALYRDPAVWRELGEAWVVSTQRVFGGADKVTLILPGAIEADFVILKTVELRAAFAALRAPGLAALWPPPLKFGVRDLKIVASPGWRVVKGGAAWERRYARLGNVAPWPRLTETEFHEVCAAFWAAAVWIAKKIARGELRAAQRHFHISLTELHWRLLEEEARDQSRPARPEARRAERWLPPTRVGQTGFATAAEGATLRLALGEAIAAFGEVAAALAQQRGWRCRDFLTVRMWLLEQIGTRATGR
jgi:hypothetical protein